MSKFTDWTKDFASGLASIAREAVVEGYQDLKPVMAAGLQDAQELFTQMSPGVSLAGEASVAGSPGVLTQMQANEAVGHDSYGEWLSQMQTERSQPQAQPEAER